MTDYRIDLKVRNERLLSALESIGETASSFAKRAGKQPSTMCALVAMKISPKYADGMWRPEIMALCEATGKAPSDLFTARQLEGVKDNRKSKTVSEDQLKYQVAEMSRHALLAADPETITAQKELCADLLGALNPREALVVTMRADGATLETVAQELGVGRERVRQIEYRSNMKMRKRAMQKHDIRVQDDMRDLYTSGS